MVTGATVRVGVGTRFIYDGELAEVVDMATTQAGTEVVLKATRSGQFWRAAVRELLTSARARVVPDGPGPSAADLEVPASTTLAMLTAAERNETSRRAAHVREVLTGYRSGSADLAADWEPRALFAPELPLTRRYEAKAAELGVSLRTIKQWVADFRSGGEAGLARKSAKRVRPLGTVDDRWVDTALEVMAEHADQSRPSRTMVIARASARVAARFGPGVVQIPSRATAFRVLGELERRHPTFRLSTKRNRDIAARLARAYGKLRPARPGEYLLMDTTRLDVFALDPVTLRWVQAELTVAMDWYTRCITGLRLTPVSTKAVGAAATLYQAYRPRPAGKDWPAHAVWPEHGVPRSVLIDRAAITGPAAAAAGPAIVPETLVVDHGKIYVSDHLTSVCNRLGISIQPARLRTGRDKGPVERFFRTLREDLLQVLPGYKGPDVHSRGLDPESEAFFYLDELEAIIREWAAAVYHHRPHDSLVDPHLPALRMSPAQMFEHGVERAGYIEAPRDPDLAYEFLKTEWRTIQHYGAEVGGRRYNGPALNPYRNMTSPYPGTNGRWPVHTDPDDVTRAYFRDPHTRHWHTLWWEHASSLEMPLSEDALRFARRLAAARYTYPDDKIAVADLLERWNLGLGATPAERRMALRLSRDQSALIAGGEPAQPAVSDLPSVARVLASSAADEPPGLSEQVAETGDDETSDLEALGEDDLYADVLEDVTPVQAPAPSGNTQGRLDNLTLARKEGWQQFVYAAPRVQPEHLTRNGIGALGEAARQGYNQRRRDWHANLGPLKTPQLAALHEDLWDIVDSNAQDGDKAKGAVAIDAFPGLGKTTAVLAFAKYFHQREITTQGTHTPDGHDRWPVCRVGLTGNTGMRDFNRAMLEFFAHPGSTRGTAADFAHRALDCILSCQVRLLIIDDLHFLRWRATPAIEVSNHFKYIANEFPVTLLFVGVGLAERGLFSEGSSYSDAVLAQTGRRTTALDMRPFTVNTERGRREWRHMLVALEHRLVLVGKRPGMLADDLSDYLFARSTGHIGSLMTLINRGCQRAVRTGTEHLDEDLLDEVKNDAAAEKARRELQAALAARRITTKPARRTR